VPGRPRADPEVVPSTRATVPRGKPEGAVTRSARPT
jgi:hypothetical protein